MKDVILIGGGIMSANLGVMLKRLSPELEMGVYEANGSPGNEASKGWNNAGTGHAGICELYLTPYDKEKCSVDVSKAVSVFAQYFRSIQFWSHAVREGLIDRPRDFINPMPHMSFVRTAEQVEYLKERYRRLSAHHFFSEMSFTTDREKIGEWAPLLLDQRRDSTPLAASRMEAGTEVDFGSLARKLLGWLGQQPGSSVLSSHRVISLKEAGKGWQLKIRDQKTGAVTTDEAKFVFIGAGGGSLPLLQKAGIRESMGYAGFPVGGQWLVCKRPEIVGRHHAKIYGQAAIGTTPSMALPHLDTRIIGGERSILFGPLAKLTTRFLDQAGSPLDLLRSVRPDNLGTLIHSGLHNLPLLRYMLHQGTQSMAERIRTLRIYYPGADEADWKLVDAGIRVQVIKKAKGGGSDLHFDTEIVTNAAGTISALLGASPGASISAYLMLGVIRRCLPHLLESPCGRQRMEAMMPGFEIDLTREENAAFYLREAELAAAPLGLNSPTRDASDKPAIATANQS